MLHHPAASAPAARAVALLLLFLLAASGAASVSFEKGEIPNAEGAYFVVLKSPPAATYRGDVSGYDATQVQQARSGADSSTVQKLDVNSAAVVAYASYLEAQSAAVAATADVASDDLLYTYKLILAGFAARVTSAKQLAALRRDRRVASVARTQWVHALTFSTPGFLGLEGNSSSAGSSSGGAWDQVGGVGSAGEDVSICVIDTGIEPEHPSFSDRQNTSSDSGPYAYSVSSNALYGGNCPVGEEFPAGTCNRKLVGCQPFSKGYIAGAHSLPEGDVNSCRDGNQHGTHVAATAGGNRVDISTGNRAMVISGAAGVAPRARLAAYKALWGSEGVGTTIDIVYAIEKAIADGCDIINMSLGGTIASFVGAYSIAIMNAAAAGISLVMAAGNQGPQPGTVSNPFPYATIVAASTHSRHTFAFVRANGTRYVGAGFYAKSVGPARLMLANAAALPSVKRSDAQLCFNDTLDPAKVTGTIVVCDRGISARADKAKEVKRAGGIGMLLLNVPDGATEVMTEILAVPHIHLKAASHDAIRTYAATRGASAQLLPTKSNDNARAPQMANFSSRGPAGIARGAFMTPDVTAPGVHIYAPVSRKVTGMDYNFLSGTSMASPHVAGLSALLRQRYPRWSPMAIKSALMTTAYQETKTGKPGLPFCKPFDCGAGHVNPPQMFSPGLIFDSSYEDWAMSLCLGNIENRLPTDMFKRYCRACPSSPIPSGQPNPCRAANLNIPSISLPDLAEGTPEVLYRTVTSVLDTAASFYGTGSVDSASDQLLQITSITPASFTLNPGESQLLRIEVVAQPGALKAGWMYGSINWRSNKDTNTRIPLAGKVSMLDAPFEVSPTVAAIRNGLLFAYSVTPGVTGQLKLTHGGLTPADLMLGSFSTGDYGVGNVTVPEGTTYARFAVFQKDFREADGSRVKFMQNVNLDLFDKNGMFLATSESDSPDEQISLVDPAPGVYKIGINAINVADNVRIYVSVWSVSSQPSPNMQYRRTRSVKAGVTATVRLQISKDLDFSRATPGTPPKRYLGRITPSIDGQQVDATTVSIVA